MSEAVQSPHQRSAQRHVRTFNTVRGVRLTDKWQVGVLHRASQWVSVFAFTPGGCSVDEGESKYMDPMKSPNTTASHCMVTEWDGC
jgi:hypothetical protein